MYKIYIKIRKLLFLINSKAMLHYISRPIRKFVFKPYRRNNITIITKMFNRSYVAISLASLMLISRTIKQDHYA